MDTVRRKYLMIFNCILLAIGATGGPLLIRLYFVRGGKRIWFASMLASAVAELVYIKAKQSLTYSLVIEMQIVMAVLASLFCIVGMIVNNDHKIYFVGTAGVIFCSTSLLAGIIAAVMLPITEILSVVFYNESFKSEKGIALFLSLWGFISYLYGGYKEHIEAEKQSSELKQDENLPPQTSNLIY
ncbi:purine permease 1-like [Papaver somniferum]|uniref:purine permease 1-like n=1 Tax=Papaver somniferum TaxID=3469 RepID=UPI000E6FD5F6|nr:purine permease 1-like [Papaver somniferum]